VKARRDGHVVSVAVISCGRRQRRRPARVLGLAIGTSEARPSGLTSCASSPGGVLRGVKLVVSDAHEG